MCRWSAWDDGCSVVGCGRDFVSFCSVFGNNYRLTPILRARRPKSTRGGPSGAWCDRECIFDDDRDGLSVFGDDCLLLSGLA